MHHTLLPLDMPTVIALAMLELSFPPSSIVSASWFLECQCLYNVHVGGLLRRRGILSTFSSLSFFVPNRGSKNTSNLAKTMVKYQTRGCVV